MKNSIAALLMFLEFAFENVLVQMPAYINCFLEGNGCPAVSGYTRLWSVPCIGIHLIAADGVGFL